MKLPPPARWEVCKPEFARNFSGVGYFFAARSTRRRRSRSASSTARPGRPTAKSGSASRRCAAHAERLQEGTRGCEAKPQARTPRLLTTSRQSRNGPQPSIRRAPGSSTLPIPISRPTTGSTSPSPSRGRMRASPISTASSGSAAGSTCRRSGPARICGCRFRSSTTPTSPGSTAR